MKTLAELEVECDALSAKEAELKNQIADINKEKQKLFFQSWELRGGFKVGDKIKGSRHVGVVCSMYFSEWSRISNCDPKGKVKQIKQNGEVGEKEIDLYNFYPWEFVK